MIILYSCNKVASENRGNSNVKLYKNQCGYEGRIELHEALSLIGAEISINSLPTGAGGPFIHSHKNN